jgi:hypothetical protein
LTSGYDHDATFTISGKIYEVLSQKLNFQLERELTEESNRTDLYELIYIQNILYENNYDFSDVLYTDYLTFTVPAGEPYTQLEKMFLMYDRETWICIAVTLAGSMLIIQVINLMSNSVKRFVFGQEIRTPMLNLANVFLNGGQIRVPGRNFARFLLMMFIVWSLLIRTCYQSELYKNLQTDMRRPKIQSVDELNEQNFTLQYQEGSDMIFNETLKK